VFSWLFFVLKRLGPFSEGPSPAPNPESRIPNPESRIPNPD
jgi:hypothetical protein